MPSGNFIPHFRSLVSEKTNFKGPTVGRRIN